MSNNKILQYVRLPVAKDPALSEIYNKRNVGNNRNVEEVQHYLDEKLQVPALVGKFAVTSLPSL
ncbi:MAG: hypothetical protein ABI369_02350, partial [Acetobacteraceae bacterium]